MSHAYVCRDSLISRCESHMTDCAHEMRVTPYLYVCHDSFYACNDSLISRCESHMTDGAQDMCDKSHLYVCHDSFLCVP